MLSQYFLRMHTYSWYSGGGSHMCATLLRLRPLHLNTESVNMSATLGICTKEEKQTVFLFFFYRKGRKGRKGLKFILDLNTVASVQILLSQTTICLYYLGLSHTGNFFEAIY